jgi:putative membrane protein
MIAGYAMVNTIPSVLLAAPDESAFFTVLPGQKYLMRGRGYEAVMITAAGGLVSLLVLVPVLALFGPRSLPVAYKVFRPHAHWIIWCVICFMLLSEWPKGGTFGQGGWKRFADGWKSTGAGILTFLASGLLGFILIYKSPVPASSSFQSLMPAFVGLFTLPWLILNIAGNASPPRQTMACSDDFRALPVIGGTAAGMLGGGFAAFFPVITGGVGGMLAGHATALRDDRSFLASQGASKLVYYVGGFLLLFVPGLGLTRGGGASMLRTVYVPLGAEDFHTALAAAAAAGCLSFLGLRPLSWAVMTAISRVGYRRISWGALAVILVLVCATTGSSGLLVMLTATGIGLLPVLFGSRRMNCLGVILLPIACNMSGIGFTVASWLRLV